MMITNSAKVFSLHQDFSLKKWGDLPMNEVIYYMVAQFSVTQKLVLPVYLRVSILMVRLRQEKS